MPLTSWSRRVAALAAVLVLSSLGTAPVTQAKIVAKPKPRIVKEIAHDTSRKPLRAMKGVKPRVRPEGDEEDGQLEPNPSGPTTDPVRQTGRVTTAAAQLQGFEGLGAGMPGPNAAYNTPPDPNLAVGTSQVAEIVNNSYAVFDKTGNTLLGPNYSTAFWDDFDAGECTNSFTGDSVIRYDNAAGRWVVAEYAVGGDFYVCVAVSTSSDATGKYNRYAFPAALFPDYPKFGVWPDAYYLTSNYFPDGGSAYAEVCALDRTAMINGTAAGQQCFATTSYSLLPADVDGGTPPLGAPNPLVGLGSSQNTLNYYTFHVDWTNPSNTTLTGPTSLSVATWPYTCFGCVPQPGTPQQLEALSDRAMFRLAYRNFGDHESLVFDHTVTPAGGPSGVRWYELRIGAGGTPSVYQQGTWSPDSAWRFQGSIAQDKVGNMGLGYTVSSGTVYPSIRFTGRLAGDPLGQMTQGEGTIQAGSGSQTTDDDRDRWGDYTSMNIDPFDRCTFWYANEYLVSGSNSWRTRIGTFSLPNCSVANSDFEAATLAGWNPTGTTGFSTTGPHGGAQSVQLGAATPTNGDSQIVQTFIAPYGAHSVSFWYRAACTGTVTTDWATATIYDFKTSTTSTVLPKTCTNDGVWRQATATITGGRAYRLTLVNHDDNTTGTATSTKYDDVTFS
ncbi:hypothetical protein [Actinomadura rayongensis]|uniref:hypothetical protein n=1 Tax=Actinomadura rayongensis TaxID=1429076 RepID=UPI0019281B69|nr:hypothetical protein [Actinomadura rayongensis]